MHAAIQQKRSKIEEDEFVDKIIEEQHNLHVDNFDDIRIDLKYTKLDLEDPMTAFTTREKYA